MNDIKKGRNIGKFTRGKNEGKLRYELVPKILFDCLDNPIQGAHRWDVDREIKNMAYDFRFGDGLDPYEMARAIIAYKYPHKDGYGKVLRNLCQLYTDGAEVHGDNNWKTATSEALPSFKESFYRHFVAMEAGECEEDHFSACLFNLFGAFYCTRNGSDC